MVFSGIKAAIFDLDGTLFDSVWVWSRVDEEFLHKRGFEPTDEYRHGIAALGNRECARFTIEMFGLEEKEDDIMAEWADMARHEYENNVGLVRGAGEYVKTLAARGIKLYVVTSLARELAELGLKHNGIFDCFERILTADETGLSKRTAEVFERVAALAGARPHECVVFDDISAAIRSAKRAGMHTVSVRGEYGYDDGEAGVAADVVIEDFINAPEVVG